MTFNAESVAISGKAALRNRQAFAAWAPVYDSQPNPLLTLEERYVKRLLPTIAGRSVLDAGCGSGRWLRYLDHHAPHSLHGLDPSEEMLHVAAGKDTSARLINGSCVETPFPDRSFDLILSSFVLSYIDDLSRCAAEFGRIARPDCDLFLSDMHPETQRRLGWERSFSCANRTIDLRTECWDLDEIAAAFTRAGWMVRAALDPEFGLQEQRLFESLGRSGSFRKAAGLPAIYLLHLQKSNGAATFVSDNARDSDSSSTVNLRGASWTLGAAELQTASSGVIGSRIISVIGERCGLGLTARAAQLDIDLRGYLLLPGLINAHDHLEFALFPRLAGRLYNNATEWAEDIHRHFAGIISQHRSIPMRARLWWGGLRNLLCGAITVCHHNPSSVDFEDGDFPVEVVSQYGWGHSLRFCDDLKAAHDATPEDDPFLVHACEGTDSSAHRELRALNDMGVLNSRTILIHGLALDLEGAELLRNRGTSLVVCPSSNVFLFGNAPSLDILDTVGAIALGSDSPLTACGDLLDEIRFAAQHCGLSPERIYSMVTESPAAMLRLPDRNGALRISAPGNAIAVRDVGLSPAETLCSLSSANIELVLRNGRVFLASEEMIARLPAGASEGLEPLSIDGTIRWLRGPIGEMLQEAESVLGKNQVRLGGKQVRDAGPHSGCIGQMPLKELTHAG